MPLENKEDYPHPTLLLKVASSNYNAFSKGELLLTVAETELNSEPFMTKTYLYPIFVPSKLETHVWSAFYHPFGYFLKELN